ncbi:MAG: septum site-determining protein MinC, partial [Granulosicoccaceae bacterium]
LSFLDSSDAQPSELDGQDLLDCIRSHNLLPIVASVSNKSSPLAGSIALPLIEGGAQRQRVISETPAPGKSAEVAGSSISQAAPEATPGADLALTPTEVEYVIKTPMLVNRPVRSGQQVYARDTDLIVMGSIGAGAEVIADGNIHVYGPLRGKALCGVSGNTETRIFCQSLEAELVSVAGNYRLLEEIPEDLHGKPAQIWLDKDRLNIEPL